MSFLNDFISLASHFTLPSGISASRAMKTGERIIQYREMASERAKQEFSERVYSFKSGRSTYAEALPEERKAWIETQKSKSEGLLNIVVIATEMESEL